MRRSHCDVSVDRFERSPAGTPTAIGELCELAGSGGSAAYWKKRALTAYLQSAQYGEVYYYNNLVDYYKDVVEDGAEAVK
jgi:hypothetical protein